MQYATCITESVYHDALTYGRKYAILGIKDDPHHPIIKVQGDNGRVRWFPASCFDLTGVDVPRLEAITICDDLAIAASAAIEVEISLSDGQRRWCFFATPEALMQFGDWIDGTTIRVHYGAPHLIIVDQLDETIIDQALRHIEGQGELLACTRAIEALSDDPAE
jgi:hypothetical protein